MVCGTTVVATDCESGPSEILADGEYGYMAPVGEPFALRDRILEALDNPLKPETVKNRAYEFTRLQIMPQYERYLFY